MSRSVWFSVIASLAGFGQTCYAQSIHPSVSASAHEVEGGQGEHKTGRSAISANYSNPLGGGASASASVGWFLVTDPDHPRSGDETLGLKAFATATGGSGDGRFIQHRGSASALWDEVLSVEVEDDPVRDDFGIYLQFIFRMSGSSSGDTASSFDFVVVDDFTGEVMVQKKELDVFDEGFENVPFYADRYRSGRFHLNFALDVSATGHGSGFGGLPHTSTADFSQTVTLLSIAPRDAEGNLIPGVTIESASGFDYNPLIVPEPSGEADFDSDDDVDGADFITWQRGAGVSNATFTQGDATEDGVVDGSDLSVWKQQFATAQTTSSVPEPSAFMLLSVGVFSIIFLIHAHQLSNRQFHG